MKDNPKGKINHLKQMRHQKYRGLHLVSPYQKRFEFNCINKAKG